MSSPSNVPANVDPQTALRNIAVLAQQGLTYQPPPPPPQPLFIINYLCPKPGRFVRETMVRLLADGRLAVYLPRPTGVHYPMDVKVIGLSGLFDVVTDFPGHWGDSTAYRQYTNPNPGSIQLGIRLAPATYDPTQAPVVAVADYRVNPITTISMVNKTLVDTKLSKAQVYFELRKGVDFGGDLGVQDPLVTMYYYDYSTPLAKKLNLAQTLEEFYWVEGSSWAQWTKSNLQTDAAYLIDPTKTVLYNKFIPDTIALPVLPDIAL